MLGPLFRNPIRSDPAGDGHFGAPRGSRKHTGVDFVCVPGAEVLSPISGIVTKLGYTYGSGYGDYDPNTGDGQPFRYVEVQNPDSRIFYRFLYVYPEVRVGDFVSAGALVGSAQDVTLRYPGQGMTPHVHFEAFREERKTGNYLDPELMT